MLYQEAESRRKELEGIIREAQKRVDSAPKGLLTAYSRGNNTQFYWRSSDDAKNAAYISSKNTDLIARLAQKEYDTKILHLASRQKKLLDALIHNKAAGLSNAKLCDIYDKMHSAKKQYVIPVEISNEQYAESWQNEEYDMKPFAPNHPSFMTHRGERVRSKSELIIANALHSHGIKYRYEMALDLGLFYRIHVDFTVLNARTREVFFWEHFGMLDDEDYRRNALERISSYEKAGYLLGKKLIATHETKDNPLDTSVVESYIHEFLL